MEALVMTAQILLALSILVGLHEMGHLLAAKLFGMRVEKFSIGFPPKIFGVRWGETEYSIGAIPLGGFVKISGMIDESLDTASMNEEPQPWEFRAKPAWQRLIVMMGGIIVNVITGIVIFIIMAYNFGDTYIPKEEVLKHGIVAYDLGEEIGLQTGDKILQVNGHDYEKFEDLTSPDVFLADKTSYTVKRDAETFDVSIPGNFIENFSEKSSARQFIDIRTPFEVEEVTEDSPAEKAGLQKGDKITAVNGQPITYFDEFQTILEENAGKPISLQVVRSSDASARRPNIENPISQTLELTATPDEDGLMGFYWTPLIDEAHIDYSLGQSVTEGTEQAFEAVWVNILAFGKIFKGELSASKSVSGPIGIAQIFGGTWNWSRFWGLTALLSMVLAFMNFLPIPALDGGHVMFLLYEIVSGRKPSDQFLEGAQKVGMVLLLSLMVFVIFNDIFKAIF